MNNVAYVIVLCFSLIFAGCGGRRSRTNLPNHVRSRFASDFRCRARNVDGTLIAPAQFHVFGCGIEAVYTCTGARGACLLSAQGPYVEGQPSALSAPQTAGGVQPAGGMVAPQPAQTTLVLETRAAEPQAAQPSRQTLDQYLQVGQATLESCGLLCPVVVHAAWAADGAVTVTLPNAPGSSAEACLKNAVEPSVRVGGGNAGGATITLPCDGQ